MYNEENDELFISENPRERLNTTLDFLIKHLEFNNCKYNR